MPRKLDDGQRKLTLEERVNVFAGEDSLSESDDGLDMIKNDGEKELSFDDYFVAAEAEEADMISISSDAEASGEDKNKTKRRRTTYGKEKGERVAFDEAEDSDAEYNKFKKRKSESRKKAIASTKRAKGRVAGSGLVGLRPKTVIKVKKDKQRVLGDESDDDNDLMETTLPDYLQKRRSSWTEQREKLGNAGLQVPPDYDDVDFSGDERLEHLKERPVLKHAKKQADYEDIDLPYSAGIIPAPIAQWLRGYQVEGVEFLHELFVYQKGGILGDDMGLGKTIQVIAFLTAAFGKTGDERDEKRMRKMRRMDDDRWYPRVLIICPGTLMANWKAELERWGWWHIYAYHGSPKDRAAALAAAHKGRLEIMITTYSTYRLNASAVNSIRWDCVIADECHTIKSRDAEITKAMNDVNALCRIGLTGTAIQNKYEELWTLLNWTNPGKLGPLSTWKQAIALPLKLGQSHDATYAQLAKARRTAEKLVKNLLPAFFLRRMKSLIAEQLPKKSDQVVFCPLTEIQAQAYDNFCDSELVRTIVDASEPCPCGSGKKQGWCCYTEVENKPWQHWVFPCLMTLQKLSNHTALLLPTGETDREQHDKELFYLQTAMPNEWRELYRQRDNIMNYANQDFCGKWKILRKLLKFWFSNGDKVLVFSHSVRLLKMLNMLFKATTTYNVSYLDGSMTYDDRQKQVDEYNSDPGQFVFLISTKAGGVGLNITSANKVVVVDPNWNPAYDLQAQDRAYRIGQTRDVEVFRLVSVGTVEEIVYARQIYKQQQANIGYSASVERRYFSGVQDQKGMKGEIFGLRNLFAPLRGNVRLRDIVNKTNVAETRAGVEIADLDFEASQEPPDDDAPSNPLVDEDGMKEDAVMSQLAAEIIDAPAGRRKAAQKGAKKKDAVQAILASAGVEYTHENAEVVGTSKIEMKISSRAQKTGADVDMGTDYAFARNASQLDVPAESRSRTRTPLGNEDDETDDDLDADDGLGKVRYKYRPPEDVRRRQFCSMAKMFGYEGGEGIAEFALVVEGWTQEQRRDCLEKFYSQRRKRVAELR
jgi:SNF2 family DNA or RNA helicase